MLQAHRALCDVTVGNSARVVRLGGPAEIRQRLREMGVTTGVMVRLVRTAPLGDPFEFQVRGYRLSLRRSEAEHVFVEGET